MPPNASHTCLVDQILLPLQQTYAKTKQRVARSCSARCSGGKIYSGKRWGWTVEARKVWNSFHRQSKSGERECLLDVLEGLSGLRVPACGRKPIVQPQPPLLNLSTQQEDVTTLSADRRPSFLLLDEKLLPLWRVPSGSFCCRKGRRK